MDISQDEDPSSHELLAREFERWQKEYYDGVNAPYSRGDRDNGEVAFDMWEQRFLNFLEQEAPSLIPIYKRSIQTKFVRYTPLGPSIYQTWKDSKGNMIEAILSQAIADARVGRLTPRHTLSDSSSSSKDKPIAQRKIFIGHGRSNDWRDLKDLLQDRLNLEWDEFNRESTAGITTIARLEVMLNEASFAFLVMTAEDEHHDSTLHARENVIHEAGLFQGKLGFQKAIILLEEGCAEFSNIKGLTYIPFPKGNIRAISEEIRRVLEREGILPK